MEDQNPLNNDNELETLEDQATLVEPSVEPEASQTGTDSPAPTPVAGGPKPPRFSGLKKRLQSFNVYLLSFGLVIVLGIAIAVIAYVSNKNDANTTPISSQTLDQKALEQLASTDATVGSNTQVLNVQSSAVFAGKVLVRDSLEVAGGIQVGGSLSLSGVSVSGSSNFGQVQVNKNLAVLGDTALQGVVTVQKNINVNGAGIFSGPVSATQITASSLQLNGELTLTHHITAGGPTPGRSNGPALGSGGTASVSGSDTSGSVSINTGSGAGAGCFITVNFAAKYNSTPHVTITPVSSGAAGLAYYITRSTSNFSICTTSTPPSNANFGFDYLVLD